MSKIIIGTVGGKNIGFDTDLLLAGRLLATADSGGGKSWLVRVLLEQTFGKVQTITIDPEGEFASLREKFPFVLAGKGGDTPTDLRSAGMLAHRLLKLRVSAVCDLYELKSDLRHLWVKTFLEALIEAPKELRTPCLIVVDEAHMFCPERGQGESEATQACVDLCTRGRKRGLCAVFVTQRLAMLSKNATSQLQNRLIGPTFEDVNIDRAIKLLGIPDGKAKQEFHQQIQLLEPGNFFALGRAISRERVLVHVREVQTTHPKAFEKHTAPPPPIPEKIKGLLPQLADLPKEAEEKAHTEAEFRREIRELQHKLKAAERAQPAAPSPNVRADPALARTITRLRAAMEDAMKIIAKITAHGFDGANLDQAQITAAVNKAADEIARLAARAVDARKREFDQLKKQAEGILAKLEGVLGNEKSIDVAVDVHRQEPMKIVPVPARENRVAPVANINGVTPAQSRIIRAAAEFHAIGVAGISKKWLAARAGASHKSSAFSNNLGALRSGGLLDYRNGDVYLTAAGLESAGPQKTPLNAEDMASSCRNLLTPAQQRIFNALYDAYPQPLTKHQLAELAGASPSSSAFSNNLGAMRSAGMIDYGGDGTVHMQKWVLVEVA